MILTLKSFPHKVYSSDIVDGLAVGESCDFTDNEAARLLKQMPDHFVKASAGTKADKTAAIRPDAKKA